MTSKNLPMFAISLLCAGPIVGQLVIPAPSELAFSMRCESDRTGTTITATSLPAGTYRVVYRAWDESGDQIEVAQLVGPHNAAFPKFRAEGFRADAYGVDSQELATYSDECAESKQPR